MTARYSATATTSDFNVGLTSDGELIELVERERESGV